MSRGGFQRWRSTVPMSGYWSTVDLAPPDDLLELEELNKDRVRVLLDRYGILFRELLQRESPAFQWRSLFRSLRLMELSGEIATGYFFKAIPGPQFIDPAALRVLQEDRDRWFWLNAADPISPCGLGLPVADELPRRVAGNHLVYRGTTLALVSERRGQRLTFLIEPDEVAPSCLDLFQHLLYRSIQPLRQITLEEINGEAARTSPYLTCFEQRFRVARDHRGMYLERRS